MNAIEAKSITHRFGSVHALDDVTLTVPEGAVYALLGPNGAGKTTLLHILMGLRRATAGSVSLLGTNVRDLTTAERVQIGYVAEGQRLPDWMKLQELEAYLAPMYPTWDASLANDLRRRFRLDSTRRLKTFSRGEQMKAALLCTLAARPRLLLMDEPFSGMDAAVKDELVRGLLESAATEGWTVVISSHDLAELESLCDWVGFLDRGKLLLSEPMEEVNARFKVVDVLFEQDALPVNAQRAEWLSVERAGRRMSFVTSRYDELEVRNALPGAVHVDARDATLREIFIALARSGSPTTANEEALV
jgi:ABC-2 type transport system ATP-binding protein